MNENISAASSVANVVHASTDEILKTYLVKALEKTGNLVDKSVDIVMEQAPILVQEVLHWNFAYNLILFVFAIISFIILIVIDRKAYNYVKNIDDIWLLFPVGVINVFWVMITSITLMNVQWLKIAIAPRLWLIEYTAQLIKVAH